MFLAIGYMVNGENLNWSKAQFKFELSLALLSQSLYFFFFFSEEERSSLIFKKNMVLSWFAKLKQSWEKWRAWRDGEHASGTLKILPRNTSGKHLFQRSSKHNISALYPDSQTHLKLINKECYMIKKYFLLIKCFFDHPNS